MVCPYSFKKELTAKRLGNKEGINWVGVANPRMEKGVCGFVLKMPTDKKTMNDLRFT